MVLNHILVGCPCHFKVISKIVVLHHGEILHAWLLISSKLIILAALNYSGTWFRNCFGFSLLHAECCDWLKKSLAASNSANWIRIRADTKTLSVVHMCFPSLTSVYIISLAFSVFLSRYRLHSSAPIPVIFFRSSVYDLMKKGRLLHSGESTGAFQGWGRLWDSLFTDPLFSI